MKKYKFIDLCSGIGGFHFALHKIGLSCVYASEIDEDCRVSYEKNFKKKSPHLFESNLFGNDLFNRDIFEIESKKIPDFDICCAGFPCQPFSQMRKQ